jgi:hypothetical protein
MSVGLGEEPPSKPGKKLNKIIDGKHRLDNFNVLALRKRNYFDLLCRLALLKNTSDISPDLQQETENSRLEFVFWNTDNGQRMHEIAARAGFNEAKIIRTIKSDSVSYCDWEFVIELQKVENSKPVPGHMLRTVIVGADLHPRFLAKFIVSEYPTSEFARREKGRLKRVKQMVQSGKVQFSSQSSQDKYFQ